MKKVKFLILLLFSISCVFSDEYATDYTKITDSVFEITRTYKSDDDKSTKKDSKADAKLNEVETYLFNYAGKKLSLLNLYPKSIESLNLPKANPMFVVQNSFVSALINPSKPKNPIYLKDISNIRYEGQYITPISMNENYIAYQSTQYQNSSRNVSRDVARNISLYDIKNKKNINTNITDVDFSSFRDISFKLISNNILLYQKDNSLYAYPIKETEDAKETEQPVVESKMLPDLPTNINTSQTRDTNQDSNGDLYHGKVLESNYFLTNGNLNSVAIEGDKIFFAQDDKIYSINMLSIPYITNIISISSLKKLVLSLPFDFDSNFDAFFVANGRLVVAKNRKDIFLFDLQNNTANKTQEKTPQEKTPQEKVLDKIYMDSLPYTSQIKDGFLTKDSLVILSKDYKSGMYVANIYTKDGKKQTKQLHADARLFGKRIISLNGNGIEIFNEKLESIFKQTFKSTVINYGLSENNLVVFEGDALKIIDITTKKETLGFPISKDYYKEKEKKEVDNKEKKDTGSNKKDANSKGTKDTSKEKKDTGSKVVDAKDTSSKDAEKKDAVMYNFEKAPLIGQGNVFSQDGAVQIEKVKTKEGEDVTLLKDELGADIFKSFTKNVAKSKGSCQDITENNVIYKNSCKNPSLSIVINIFDLNGLWETLDTLEYFQTDAEFFITEEMMEMYPDVITILKKNRYNKGKGYNVGYITPNYLNYITKDILVERFNRFKELYKTITGVDKTKFYWHTYYYTLDTNIIKIISQLKSYTFVSRDIDTFDWVQKNSELGYSLYKNADKILQEASPNVQVNSILPITIGMRQREDYLWEKLSFLLVYLQGNGYILDSVTK